MEVWALEGYGAAHTLREMLTVKSDDIVGRTETFESIIRGYDLVTPHIPASFKVLLNYLRGLTFDVRMNRELLESGGNKAATLKVALDEEELSVEVDAEPTFEVTETV